MSLGPLNFRRQPDEARFKLLDRIRIEIEPGQSVQRIARPPRQIFVGFHGAQG